MNHCAKHIVKVWGLACCLLGLGVMSCTDLIFDSREGCEHGLFIDFRYDYNLQRADMFPDHVGEVTVYVFDEEGKYLEQYTEANDGEHRPLKDRDYTMYLDLPGGKYRFVAVAYQENKRGGTRAGFQASDLDENSRIEDLQVTLEHIVLYNGIKLVNHQGEPLDTLWHTMNSAPTVEVLDGQYNYHTLPLMRNTKYISVTLRDIDDPDVMNIEDYELYITNTNVRLNYDNSEAPGATAVCTPYVTWNTQDPDTRSGTSVGNMGHADFMTSRIFVHENMADDAVLVVRHKQTGKTVIEVNLPDLLGRLSNFEDLHRYSKQEFLDRGYDYDLSFFLSGGSWVYANVSIGVLGWSKRVQNVDL